MLSYLVSAIHPHRLYLALTKEQQFKNPHPFGQVSVLKVRLIPKSNILILIDGERGLKSTAVVAQIDRFSGCPGRFIQPPIEIDGCIRPRSSMDIDSTCAIESEIREGECLTLSVIHSPTCHRDFTASVEQTNSLQLKITGRIELLPDPILSWYSWVLGFHSMPDPMCFQPHPVIRFLGELTPVLQLMHWHSEDG